MTTVLPTQITYGTVMGQLIQAVGDSSDADQYPDSTPVQGTVTFTPSVSSVLLQGATPPVTVLPQPITVTLDSTGAFSVSLISTDNPNMNPSGWTYTVSFGLIGVSYGRFSIAVPANTTVDITTVAPISQSNGATIIRGIGIPAGGTAGQTLAKASSTDYDMSWITPEGNVVFQHGPPTDPNLYPVGTFVVDVDDNMHVYEISS